MKTKKVDEKEFKSMPNCTGAFRYMDHYYCFHGHQFSKFDPVTGEVHGKYPKRPVITSWDAHILVSVIMNMQVWKSYTAGESNLALEKKKNLESAVSLGQKSTDDHIERETVQPCALGCYYIWWQWQYICFQRWVSHCYFIQTALGFFFQWPFQVISLCRWHL